MYALTDIFDGLFVGHSILSVLSACDNALCHRYIENALSTPVNIALKWSLKVLMALLAAFQYACLGEIFGTQCHAFLLFLGIHQIPHC